MIIRSGLPLTLFMMLAAAPARADRVDELCRALTSDASWRVRLQAAVVLGKLGDRRAEPALEDALGDVNETVRGMAAQLLGDLGGETAVAALKRAQRDRSAFVREKALAALEKIAPLPLARETEHEHAAPSGTVHIELGGVGLKAKAPVELKEHLRNLLARELMHTPGVSIQGRGTTGYLLESSITQMTKKNVDNMVEVSCEVSFIVGKLPSKAMVMMTTGGATVQAPRVGFRPAQETVMQRDALEGAVKGAHENLLAFLKTTQPPTVGRAVRR